MQLKINTWLAICAATLFINAQPAFAYQNDMTVTPLFDTTQPLESCGQKETLAFRYKENVEPLFTYLLLSTAPSLPTICYDNPLGCLSSFTVINMASYKYLATFNAYHFLNSKIVAVAITNNIADPISYSDIVDLTFSSCPAYPSIPRLVPGNGLPPILNNLGPRGSPSNPESGKSVIARWTSPEYGIIFGGTEGGLRPAPDKFYLSVSAAHTSGIEKAVFIIKPLTGVPGYIEIYNQVMNPETGLKEYVVEVNANDIPPGPVDFEFVAVPIVGIPIYVSGNPTSYAITRSGRHKMYAYNNRGNPLPRPEINLRAEGVDNSTCGNLNNPCESFDGALTRIRTINALAGFGNNSVDGAIIQMGSGTFTLWNVDRAYGHINRTELAPLTIRGDVRGNTVFNRTVENPSFYGPTLLQIEKVTLKPWAKSGMNEPPIIAHMGGPVFTSLTLKDSQYIGRGRDPVNCSQDNAFGGFMLSYATNFYSKWTRGSRAADNSLRVFYTDKAGVAYENIGLLAKSGAGLLDHTVKYLCGLPPSTSPHGDYVSIENPDNAMFLDLHSDKDTTNISQGFFISMTPGGSAGGVYVHKAKFRVGPPGGSSIGAALLISSDTNENRTLRNAYFDDVEFLGGSRRLSCWEPPAPNQPLPDCSNALEQVVFKNAFPTELFPSPDSTLPINSQLTMQGSIYVSPVTDVNYMRN